MRKKMAVALITAMTVAAGTGSVVVQAAPQETKAEDIKISGDVDLVDIMNKDIYYIGVGENDESIVLGASEDWSDYEAVITEGEKMTIVTSREEDEQKGKETEGGTDDASVKVSEDKESITLTLPDGRTLKAEKSDFMKSIIELGKTIDTFESAVERGELEVE